MIKWRQTFVTSRCGIKAILTGALATVGTNLKDKGGMKQFFLKVRINILRYHDRIAGTKGCCKEQAKSSVWRVSLSIVTSYNMIWGSEKKRRQLRQRKLGYFAKQENLRALQLLCTFVIYIHFLAVLWEHGPSSACFWQHIQGAESSLAVFIQLHTAHDTGRGGSACRVRLPLAHLAPCRVLYEDDWGRVSQGG